MTKNITIPDEVIINKIYLIRKQKVMIDRDLAELYGVETRVLKQAVRRNLSRFPEDFMFEMTKAEFELWRTESIIDQQDKMGLRYAPFCFTEQGVTMLSCILNSPRAIEMNIRIIRVFTRLREMLLTNQEILTKLEQLDKKIINLGFDVKMHDGEIETIFELIKEIVEEKKKPIPRNPIGFKTSKK